eukprot:COSAG04_NODE_10751_length_755_cov_2.242378_1_plen_160_part_00
MGSGLERVSDGGVVVVVVAAAVVVVPVRLLRLLLVQQLVVVVVAPYLIFAESGEHGRRQRDERELRALPPVQHDDPVPQVRHERREVLRPSPALEGHVGAQLRDVHGAGVVAAALPASMIAEATVGNGGANGARIMRLTAQMATGRWRCQLATSSAFIV